MEKIKYKGQEGYFFTEEEYQLLCGKTKKNTELIRQLQQKVGL